MSFKMTHTNINVADIDKSMAFYKAALGLEEKRRIAPEDGSYIIIFMENEHGEGRLELTWLKDKEGPYDLGDNEIHVGFVADDFDAALKKHREMGCSCFENKEMGVYFIEDPDGYWMEIIPERK